MPPPMHIVQTTYLTPRRFPSINACATILDPHVNTTDSAVRITHLPTKIVVQCQNERSQHKNKETCFKMLKARLYENEIQKREDQSKKELNSKTDIGWGYQIRSYVLQPYRLVKDLRFNIQDTNPDSVLNGDIDKFIEGSIFKSNK